MSNSAKRRTARPFPNNSETIHDTYRQPAHSNFRRQSLVHVLGVSFHRYRHMRSSLPDHVRNERHLCRLNCHLPTRYVNVALDYPVAERS